MPIKVRYDPELRILFSAAEGLVSLVDLEAHLDPESQEKALGYRDLFDATATRTDVTSEQLKLLLRRLHTTMQGGPFGPTALMTGDDKVFGMASMFSILSDLECGPSVGVFRTFDEALNWLLRPTIGAEQGSS